MQYQTQTITSHNITTHTHTHTEREGTYSILKKSVEEYAATEFLLKKKKS